MAATKENLRHHEADYATSLVLSRRLGIGSTPVNRGAAEVIQNGQICACSIEPHRSIPRHTGRVIAGRRMSGLFRDGMGLPAMTLARLYDQHAEECARSAEQTEDDKRRALLLKLAAEWRREADKLRQQATKE